MLGQSLMNEIKTRGFEVTGIARNGADVSCDISNDEELESIISSINPHILINCAAIVNLTKCEDNPGHAYLVNSRPSSIMSEISRKAGIYFVQISTDHYYTGDCHKKHSENHPVHLMNEYARTKYAAEVFALTNPNSLVVRTNVVGFRHDLKAPTFLEWVIQNLQKKSVMTLFDDYYTSSIHVNQFSTALMDIIETRFCGVLNLASRDVFSKKEFICALSDRMAYSLDNTVIGSVFDIGGTPRAESIGLDVTKAEQILGYELPTLDEVITSIIKEYDEGLNK